MADAFSLANIEAHRADFLGPGVVQTLVQALETGFLVSQSVRFWTRVAPGEPLLIRLLVAFVSLVAFFQTGAAFYSWWRIYVRNFGDWIASIDPGWPERIQSIVILTQRRALQIPLAAILLGSLITSIVVTASIFNFDFTSSLEPGAPPPPKLPVSIPFILSLALPAFLDILVTGIHAWLARCAGLTMSMDRHIARYHLMSSRRAPLLSALGLAGGPVDR
ncbi:hypothetical protein EWM64_g619 [Hericium alpestre]|uniref:Uncharacterized protein n=1 Tax=Hericium alpestre TaxID=135208 RepID=A0A4Z0AAW2_9AGAM|nr:hypothetical protein EWM64_g619 [Hericium alpestre]